MNTFPNVVPYKRLKSLNRSKYILFGDELPAAISVHRYSHSIYWSGDDALSWVHKNLDTYRTD